MRAILVLLFVATSLKATEATFTAQDIRLPVFDSSGHLIRRLTAALAAGPVDSLRLEKGQVEFFAVESREESVAILAFEKALYRKSEESISGSDSIKLTTPQGIVSGQGYDCRLETGLLTLKSQIVYSSAAFHMTGDQAEIRFDPKGAKKDEMIKEIVMTGNIVVDQIATSNEFFDKAESTFARYNAEEHKIYLKTPVTGWKNGQKGVMDLASGYIEIDLGEKPK